MLTLNLVNKKIKIKKKIKKREKKAVPPLDFAWATRVSLGLSAQLTPKLGVSGLNKQISPKKKKV
jgi:hypothetical protein